MLTKIEAGAACFQKGQERLKVEKKSSVVVNVKIMKKSKNGIIRSSVSRTEKFGN